MTVLTQREAEKIATDFLRDFPVALRELVFIFRQTSFDVHGEKALEIPVGAKAGYGSNDIFHPERNRWYRGGVHVYLENIDNKSDFLTGLRYETFGHFGINFILADQMPENEVPI